MLDMAGLGAGRLDWGKLGGDSEGDGGSEAGGLRPRSIGISEARWETEVGFRDQK